MPGSLLLSIAGRSWQAICETLSIMQVRRVQTIAETQCCRRCRVFVRTGPTDLDVLGKDVWAAHLIHVALYCHHQP